MQMLLDNVVVPISIFDNQEDFMFYSNEYQWLYLELTGRQAYYSFEEKPTLEDIENIDVMWTGNPISDKEMDNIFEYVKKQNNATSAKKQNLVLVWIDTGKTSPVYACTHSRLYDLGYTFDRYRLHIDTNRHITVYKNYYGAVQFADNIYKFVERALEKEKKEIIDRAKRELPQIHKPDKSLL